MRPHCGVRDRRECRAAVPVWLPVLGCLFLLLGELLERVLFFKAVAAPKMPGAFTS